MTDAERQQLRATCEATTPGPWFLAYATVHDGPRTRAYMRVEREIPDDAPEEAYDALPNTAVCHVPVVAGDTPTAQGARDGEFIATARTAVPRLLDEVDRLKVLAADRWALTAYRDLVEEAEVLVKERSQLRTELDEQHNAITCLRAALAEALDLFDDVWCTEHGHVSRPEQLERAAALRAWVRPC